VTGILEYWSDGIMGKTKKRFFSLFEPSIPLFQYSNLLVGFVGGGQDG
jgi:hypothetical protein